MQDVSALTPENCSGIVAYYLSEPGAMGWTADILLIRKDGSITPYNYGIEGGWEMLTEAFEGIRGCRFLGPAPDSVIPGGTVRFVGIDNIENKITKVNPGWRQFCSSYGHHLICREEYIDVFKRLFDGMDSMSIIIDGPEKLEQCDLAGEIAKADELRER